MRHYSIKRNMLSWFRIVRWIVVASFLSSVLTACGGGVNSSSDTSGALSVTQQNMEASLNDGGYYSLIWHIPAAGVSPVSGTNYVYSEKVSPDASPAKGTQTYIPAPTNLSATLALPDMAQSGIVRVVKNGKVYARSSLSKLNIYYSGDNIVIDELASDGSTVMSSEVMDSFSAPIALSMADTIRTAPTELKAAIGLLTRISDSNFDLTKTWQSGSAYIKRSASRGVDTLFTYDWSGKTYDSNVNGSNISGTLENYFANAPSGTLTIGTAQYKISDGVISTVSGARAGSGHCRSSKRFTYYIVLYAIRDGRKYLCRLFTKGKHPNSPSVCN